MLFSSPVFLFIFLPIVLALYYLSGKKIKNIVLLLASLCFYSWGNFIHLPLLIISVLINYTGGYAIGVSKKQQHRRRAIAVTLALNLALLFVFKYANFAVDNVNSVLGNFHLKAINIPVIGLPIGISFFTFHAISYVVDVYRKEVPHQKKFFDLLLYISFFPQLIAGPIIRYHDIAPQLDKRTFNAHQFARGIERFVIGLAKKIVLANGFAFVADSIFKLPTSQINIYTAWLGTMAYALQIYFDFAGYSCMAIGLGRMFGFEFKENFNFPYIARSIKDFWRRWHISLSTWFRDYLYIPLGGNKATPAATYRNLLIVFLCTGFWHGASWNFLIWGMFHGFFLVVERLGFEKLLGRLPRVVNHFYMLVVVLVGWVFFRADTLGQALLFVKSMFGFGQGEANYRFAVEYFNPEFVLVATLGILGSTTFFTTIYNKIVVFFSHPKIFQHGWLLSTAKLAYLCGVVLVFLITLSYMATNSYNPFIYFRF